MGIANQKLYPAPYKLVKDLRTDVESTNPNAVLDGDINNFLKSYLLADEMIFRAIFDPYLIFPL